MKFHRTIDYPESTLIDSLRWTSQPQRYPGTNSDMHWWTWHSDSAIYIADDDGRNFNGPGFYAHVLKIEGIPPNHTVSTVTDFQEDEYQFRQMLPDKLVRRYICGIVSVDSILYATIYDYDWNLPDKIFNGETLHSRIKEYNPWHHLDSSLAYNMGFIDGYSKHYGVAALIASYDHGKSWTNIPQKNTPRFLGPNFAALAFLTFGPGNSQTPQRLRPYIYAISNDSNWESGDHIYLARAHRDSLLYRTAWQFYSGTKEDISWTRKEEMATPIFTDKGHVGHPTMTYNSGLDRYILCVASDTYPHRENATPEQRKQWDWATELQLYEGPNPWGPWSIFYNNSKWGGDNHTCYLPQMPAPWLSNDGRSGVMMFGGDYVNRKGEYYGLMTQSFELILH